MAFCGALSWRLLVLVVSEALLAQGGRTKFVVHYLPWFDGKGGSHWCNPSWGNAWYQSVLGQYDVRNPNVYLAQLALMRAAGIDGLWVDFQSPEWVPRVDAILQAAQRMGLHFAVLADNFLVEDIMNTQRQALQQFMSMPNYYRIDGRPVLPFMEARWRWGGRSAVLPKWNVDGKQPFLIGTYHNYQDESVPLPQGLDSLFFWNSPDLLWLERRYYPSKRFSVKVPSVYRGWMEAYKANPHNAPYLGYLNRTLELVRTNEPEFAQVVTWNDYTEGTMVEPSFLRGPGDCVDPTTSYWYKPDESCHGFAGVSIPCTPALEGVPCAGSGSSPCSRVQDCTKPYGVVEGPATGRCARQGAVTLSAYRDLALIANVAAGIPVEDAVARFKDIVAWFWAPNASTTSAPTRVGARTTGPFGVWSTVTATTTTKSAFHFMVISGCVLQCSSRLLATLALACALQSARAAS